MPRPPWTTRTTNLAPDLASTSNALATFLQERACMFRCAEREKIVNGHSKRRHHQRGAGPGIGAGPRRAWDVTWAWTGWPSNAGSARDSSGAEARRRALPRESTPGLHGERAARREAPSPDLPAAEGPLFGRHVELGRLQSSVPGLREWARSRLDGTSGRHRTRGGARQRPY